MGWRDALAFRAKKAFVALNVARTRRTVALLPLSFFTLLYVFLALLSEPMWRPAFFGLAGCYLVAFMGLGAEWFWARWFASGLGYWGTMVGAIAVVNLGWHPALGLYLGLHAIVVLMLRGDNVAAIYDGRTDWRERFGLDDHGVVRLGRTVTRAAGSLPMLVLWALGPRLEKEFMGVVFGALSSVLSSGTPDAVAVGGVCPGLDVSLLGLAVLLAALLGIGLILRARSAGLLVLLTGALIGLFLASVHGRLSGIAGAGVMLLAVAPFGKTLVRYLRARG